MQEIAIPNKLLKLNQKQQQQHPRTIPSQVMPSAPKTNPTGQSKYE